MTTNFTLERLGVAALAGTGLIHLVLAPEYLSEKAYVGALFIAGGIASLALAAVLWRRPDPRVWGMAASIAVGMGIGFILSRTVGLPGYHQSEWELSGLLTLLFEGTVLTAALAQVRRGSQASFA